MNRFTAALHQKAPSQVGLPWSGTVYHGGAPKITPNQVPFFVTTDPEYAGYYEETRRDLGDSAGMNTFYAQFKNVADLRDAPNPVTVEHIKIAEPNIGEDELAEILDGWGSGYSDWQFLNNSDVVAYLVAQGYDAAMVNEDSPDTSFAVLDLSTLRPIRNKNQLNGLEQGDPGGPFGYGDTAGMVVDE